MEAQYLQRYDPVRRTVSTSLRDTVLFIPSHPLVATAATFSSRVSEVSSSEEDLLCTIYVGPSIIPKDRDTCGLTHVPTSMIRSEVSSTSTASLSSFPVVWPNFSSVQFSFIL